MSGIRRRDRLSKPWATGGRKRYDVAFYVPLIGSFLAPGARDHPPGGAETQAYLLARALAKRGLRVCLIVYQPGGDLPDQIDDVDVVARHPPWWRARRSPIGKAAEVAAIWRVVGRVKADTFIQHGTGIDTGLVAVAAKA